MKGESGWRASRARKLSTGDAEVLALDVLGRLTGDPDRLGRFLATSGLDPGSIRAAAREPGFLPAVLDHVAEDERLLVAVAAEIGCPPERLMEARHRLSPEPDWGA